MRKTFVLNYLVFCQQPYRAYLKTDYEFKPNFSTTLKAGHWNSIPKTWENCYFQSTAEEKKRRNNSTKWNGIWNGKNRKDKKPTLVQSNIWETRGRVQEVKRWKKNTAKFNQWQVTLSEPIKWIRCFHAFDGAYELRLKYMYIPTTDKIIENPTGGVVETTEIKWQNGENVNAWGVLNINLNNYHIEWRSKHNKLCHILTGDMCVYPVENCTRKSKKPTMHIAYERTRHIHRDGIRKTYDGRTNTTWCEATVEKATANILTTWYTLAFVHSRVIFLCVPNLKW